MRSRACVSRAAIGPRHLFKPRETQLDSADIASAVALVVGNEQPPAHLDLIERPAQRLLGANPRTKQTDFSPGQSKRFASQLANYLVAQGKKGLHSPDAS